MHIIIASNSYHDLVAFGPYDSEEKAKLDIPRFEAKHPSLDFLILEVDQEYMHTSLPPVNHGWRTVDGMYEKNIDTGEVRELPDYKYISDFPG